MFPRRESIFLEIFLFHLSGVLGWRWGVSYAPQEVCVVAGSSIYVDCTYTYPQNLEVETTFWYRGCSIDASPEDLSQDEQFKGRVEYLGDEINNCSLRIRDLRESDDAEYCFRFITDKWWGKWSGKPGVALSISDLQVLVAPGKVTEGNRVTLTCNATCSLSNDPTYIWYKRAVILTSNFTTGNNTLTLDPVSSEDAGSYSCAVRGQEDHPSPAVTLSVRCM
ncbi:sialic acid-binding Ig-like lectin 12 [Clupea harengus]|uniref:B-cell receptor CD22 n=1 Tax=Clupea harengus TaxID=7950 RepID=A0A6P8ENN8_CLUHA|nr:sialic acid-binding Ig-like lectin 12 [Clupea harengus]